MKNTFGAYYRPSSEELKKLWKNAVFIFDTNVLLGLYRYPRDVFEEFISVLKKISPRIWIPHQVGLEFQRNRLSVITEQVNKYSEVSNITEGVNSTIIQKIEALQLNRRHSAIDPTEFISDITNAVNSFKSHLEQLKSNHPSISDEDEIRMAIDTVFDGKVGPLPNEEFLAGVYSQGKARYEKQQPPGYLDSSKENDVYIHNNLTFERKYGDLIIWFEIIEYCKKDSVEHAIFITDDEKDDWWWKYSGKQIGPRPELLEEIQLSSNIVSFTMYNSSQFLKHAANLPGIIVTENSIQQVKEIAEVAAEQRNRHQNAYQESDKLVQRAVTNWLMTVYSDGKFILNSDKFPSIVIQQGNERMGFEVKWVRSPRRWVSIWKQSISHLYFQQENSEFDSLNLILIIEDENRLSELQGLVRAMLQESLTHIHTIIIGKVEVLPGSTVFRKLDIIPIS